MVKRHMLRVEKKLSLMIGRGSRNRNFIDLERQTLQIDRERMEFEMRRRVCKIVWIGWRAQN